jgi:hypothetical protein
MTTAFATAYLISVTYQVITWVEVQVVNPVNNWKIFNSYLKHFYVKCDATKTVLDFWVTGDKK